MQIGTHSFEVEGLANKGGADNSAPRLQFSSFGASIAIIPVRLALTGAVSDLIRWTT
jgi:hypothetical protein